MNTKLNVPDLSTKKLSQSRRKFLLLYCGSIEVEGGLVRTGQQEVDQRRKERKLKKMVFNVQGTLSNKLKRLIQLVTALALIQEGESAQVVEEP